MALAFEVLRLVRGALVPVPLPPDRREPSSRALSAAWREAGRNPGVSYLVGPVGRPALLSVVWQGARTMCSLLDAEGNPVQRRLTYAAASAVLEEAANGGV